MSDTPTGGQDVPELVYDVPGEDRTLGQTSASASSFQDRRVLRIQPTAADSDVESLAIHDEYDFLFPSGITHLTVMVLAMS